MLKKHDYTAPTVSTVRDVASLPKAMQVRNFGKMSQTKYTHLAAEDTTKGDAGWAKKPNAGGAGGAAGGCFACGGPHVRVLHRPSPMQLTHRSHSSNATAHKSPRQVHLVRTAQRWEDQQALRETAAGAHDRHHDEMTMMEIVMHVDHHRPTREMEGAWTTASEEEGQTTSAEGEKDNEIAMPIRGGGTTGQGTIETTGIDMDEEGAVRIVIGSGSAMTDGEAVAVGAGHHRRDVQTTETISVGVLTDVVLYELAFSARLSRT